LALADRAAVLDPGVVQHSGRVVLQAVLLRSRREEEDAVRQRRLRRLVEDAFTVRAEAPQRHADREGDEVDRPRRVVFGLVRRERLARRAIDGALGPGLGVAPSRWTGPAELDRGLADRFVLAER